MTGITTTSLGAGLGVEYLDESGGAIEIAITHPGYTSHHRFHVLPFGSGGSGVYNSPPTGTVPNIGQDADNIATLLKPLYFTDTSAQFVQAYQVTSDAKGVNPYPYSGFSAAGWSAGTGTGASLTPSFTATMTGSDSVGTRWRLMLPGPCTGLFGPLGKTPYASFPTALKALADYLTGLTNGPTHALKTNVVTHSGLPLIQIPTTITAANKRIRRRLGQI